MAKKEYFVNRNTNDAVEEYLNTNGKFVARWEKKCIMNAVYHHRGSTVLLQYDRLSTATNFIISVVNGDESRAITTLSMLEGILHQG